MKFHLPFRKILCRVYLFKTIFLVGLWSLTIFFLSSLALALPSGNNAPMSGIIIPEKSNLGALIIDEAKRNAFITLGGLEVVKGTQDLSAQSSQLRLSDFSSRILNDSIFNTMTGAKQQSLIGFFLDEFPPIWATESTRKVMLRLIQLYGPGMGIQ